MSAPQKKIVSPDDLNKWLESSSYNELIEFITGLQDLVVGLTNHAEVDISPNVKFLLQLLEKVNGLIDAHPVEVDKDTTRFGKVEFRDFYDDLAVQSPSLLKPLTDNTEIPVYLTESWGNRTRIDYGSGHELNFLAFLFCLQKLGLLSKQDYPALILKVFTKYIATMRVLQKNYWLEPAGSHGVWGLDDYHFLPFLFGAAQLATHPYMKPKLIHNDELVESMYKDYMYLECIHFINVIKTVPVNDSQKLSLRWHSPMLDDILAAKSWLKIKEGMVKMYKAEVLAKLPIIQHFMFGDIIRAPEGLAGHVHEDECGHVHTNTWGDCCGIKIPSAFAASEMNKKQNNYKPVPFD